MVIGFPHRYLTPDRDRAALDTIFAIVLLCSGRRGLLNLRQLPLQSQPHCLQYQSVMPSHSSRSARTALTSPINFCSDGVMIPWMMGTTSEEPHSGQFCGVDRRLCLICFRAIFFVITLQVDTS